MKRPKIQGGAKVTIPKKKFVYLPHGLSKGADFFINDRDMFKLYIHTDTLEKNPCQITLLNSTKKLSVFTNRNKKQLTIKKIQFIQLEYNESIAFVNNTCSIFIYIFSSCFSLSVSL